MTKEGWISSPDCRSMFFLCFVNENEIMLFMFRCICIDFGLQKSKQIKRSSNIIHTCKQKCFCSVQSIGLDGYYTGDSETVFRSQGILGYLLNIIMKYIDISIYIWRILVEEFQENRQAQWICTCNPIMLKIDILVETLHLKSAHTRIPRLI